MRRGLWLWAVIGCALLLHGTFLAQRAALERSNDTVELVVHYEGLESVARAAHMSPDQLLLRWQRLGITSVAVGGAESIAADGQHLHELSTVAPRIVPRTLAVAQAARARGWSVGPYIPRGEFVEGYPDDLDTTVAALAELQLPIGLVEFAVAAGVADVARRLGDDAVFVHSIPEKEIPRYTAPGAIARFYRAAFERQARLLYIHVPVGVVSDDGGIAPVRSSPELLAEIDAYIAAISDAVERAGLRLGSTGSAPRWTTPWWLPVSAAVAAGAVLALLVGRLPRLFRHKLVPYVLTGAPGLGGALLFTLDKEILARQGAALAVACVIPALAVLLGADAVGISAKGSEADRHMYRSGSQAWLRLVAGVLVVVVMGGVGAVLVAGSLGDTLFLLKLEQFRGVKLAHVIPFFLLVALWAAGGIGGGPAEVQGLSMGNRVGNRASSGTGWRMKGQHVLIGVGVIALGFVIVARTGHDVLPVSELERAMREWLERTLPVRPRTKEFFLAYPALLLGLGLGAFRSRLGGRDLATAFLIAGALVPISMMNTFAHAHVPLDVSIVRTLLGLAAGGPVGLAALGGAMLLLRRRRRVSGAVGQW